VCSIDKFDESDEFLLDLDENSLNKKITSSQNCQNFCYSDNNWDLNEEEVDEYVDCITSRVSRKPAYNYEKNKTLSFKNIGTNDSKSYVVNFSCQ
jgi:predicted transcriptional regulator